VRRSAAGASPARAWGDAWLQGLEPLFAEVPSVIVPEESNLLLNPRHPAHREVVAEIVRPWVYDARLLPALWQPAAGEPPWERELNPEPAYFQRGEAEDDQRPVEQVSWFEAMEFCRRLSRRTGRHYTLPSEAQWEYACRAGTTTPVAFGFTLSERQANRRASETTQLGSFPANAWGLHDMHGNVWEWCSDYWHPNYVRAPNDGRPWIDPGVEDGTRLLRGGSWSYVPRLCRSADRFHGRPGLANGLVGFRVVCLPQGPSLNA
jgi:formylglycine-generating enzyme required for sulfatase activity